MASHSPVILDLRSEANPGILFRAQNIDSAAMTKGNTVRFLFADEGASQVQVTARATTNSKRRYYVAGVCHDPTIPPGAVGQFVWLGFAPNMAVTVSSNPLNGFLCMSSVLDGFAAVTAAPNGMSFAKAWVTSVTSGRGTVKGFVFPWRI